MSETRMTMDTDYFFVCGYAGSGKSVYAKAIATAFDANFIEVSDIVKSIMKSNKRSEIGNKPELDVQIIEALRRVEKPAVISGVRQQSIIDAFPGSPVTFVGVPFDVREKRINKRGDEKDNVDLLEADRFDDQLGLDKIMEGLTKMKAGEMFYMQGEA